MKIEFLTDDNPIYVLPFFEEFFKHYASEFEIVHISGCRAMGKRSRRQLLRALTSLYGPLGIARVLARLLKARLLGLMPRSRRATRFHTLAQLCRAYSIPFIRIQSPNTSRFVNRVRERAPDLIVSVACPYILKEPLLSLPPAGCINIHNAPLPKYKGMMPTFWQMYNAESRVGVTIHYMSASVDEGAALFQGDMEVQLGESLDHLIRRSKRHGAHCMARVLREIAGQRHTLLTLEKTAGSYFTFPTLEQIREFRRRGLRAL
jgi:methionyl-tRNA formyltransferase